MKKNSESQTKRINERLPFYIPENHFIEIKVETEKAIAVEIVLEFLYTDRIFSLEGKETDLETLKLMMDVYKIAFEFMIPKLKKICENLIELSLSCSNVLPLLRYIYHLNLINLKEFCMKFLSKDSNFNQVIMLDDFEQLEPPLMVEIIRLRQVPAKVQQNESSLCDEVIHERCTSIEQDMENFILNDLGKLLLIIIMGTK